MARAARAASSLVAKCHEPRAQHASHQWYRAAANFPFWDINRTRRRVVLVLGVGIGVDWRRCRRLVRKLRIGGRSGSPGARCIRPRDAETRVGKSVCVKRSHEPGECMLGASEGSRAARSLAPQPLGSTDTHTHSCLVRFATSERMYAQRRLPRLAWPLRLMLRGGAPRTE
jgi:hypothetical protein